MSPWTKDADLIKLQEDIDNAILKMLHGEKGDMMDNEAPRIQSNYFDWPEPLDRTYVNADIMPIQGPYFYTLGPMLSFMVLCQDLAREKELNLRKGLNVVGVSHAAYWLSWIIVTTLTNLLQSCMFVLQGYFWNFDMWHNTPPDLLFYFYFVFCTCMTLTAFVISTIVTKQVAASSISYTMILGFILIGLVFS